MAHDVIMPMLGMVQDTGIIVAWHKQIGDAVKASDVLMEVETDKATVEIEAGFDGFVAALNADTGVPVPVGQVVAVISDDKADMGAPPAGETAAPVASPAPEAAVPPEQPAERPPEKKDEEPPPVVAAPAAPAKVPPRPDGRVRASPKARRLARERGIDLGRLARVGVPEPIHVVDLDKGARTGEAWRPSLMRVRIDREPFENFLDWIGKEAGVEADGLNVWCAFAAGSLRAATGRSRQDDIVVAASRFPDDGGALNLANPDLASLAAIETGTADGAADLTVLDLTDTLLTEYRPADERPLPHLTICNGQDAANFDLYLESDPAALPTDAAYSFLKDLAERAQVPLRHLL